MGVVGLMMSQEANGLATSGPGDPCSGDTDFRIRIFNSKEGSIFTHISTRTRWLAGWTGFHAGGSV